MNRIVQVGDVFVGNNSNRIFKVIEVSTTHATLSCGDYTWDRPLTPEGSMAETHLYTYVAPVSQPVFRKGDRVRTQGVVARMGTVEAELGNGVLAVIWDGGQEAMTRTAHVKRVPPVGPTADGLMPGDRVRLKYNNKGGTVVRKGNSQTNQYLIEWDHRSEPLYEYRHDLVVLYAPRDTDAPLPAQKAIDEVDALRDTIKAEVERLQSQLRDLKKIKNGLLAVELH